MQEHIHFANDTGCNLVGVGATSQDCIHCATSAEMGQFETGS